MSILWAKRLILLMSAECFAASVAFGWQRDWKQAAYWFFAGCINTTVWSF